MFKFLKYRHLNTEGVIFVDRQLYSNNAIKTLKDRGYPIFEIDKYIYEYEGYPFNLYDDMLKVKDKRIVIIFNSKADYVCSKVFTDILCKRTCSTKNMIYDNENGVHRYYLNELLYQNYRMTNSYEFEEIVGAI